MGWGNCGLDSQGRPIGYYHEGTCDEPGCDAEIDRGIGCACGGVMHGEQDVACEKYFCEAHANNWAYSEEYEQTLGICTACRLEFERHLAEEGLVECDDCGRPVNPEELNEMEWCEKCAKPRAAKEATP